MIVVTLTDCPPRLRGDLSKWLLEINTGVYVGQLNKRVREELWKRICDNLPSCLLYTSWKNRWERNSLNGCNPQCYKASYSLF